MIKILCDYPNKVFTLNYFTKKFSAAKSSISEDIVIAKKMMQNLGLGKIETISGASGGVKYIPYISKEDTQNLLNKICDRFMDENRILPGGFLYTADIIFDSGVVKKAGEIFAKQFNDKDIDYVVTVETKGIPIALMTANALNVPLVVLRRESKVSEGSTVSINYVSGSTGQIQRMTMSKRAIENESKVVIIDDFMKAGGTAKGMIDMMKEFNVQVEGIGILISTKEPKDKLVNGYIPLLILENVDTHNKKLSIYPNKELI